MKLLTVVEDLDHRCLLIMLNWLGQFAESALCVPIDHLPPKRDCYFVLDHLAYFPLTPELIKHMEGKLLPDALPSKFPQYKEFSNGELCFRLRRFPTNKRETCRFISHQY